MTLSRSLRSLGVVLTACTAVVALASGCTSSGGSATKHATSPAASSPSHASSGLPTGVVPVAIPTSVANSATLRKFVTITSCTKAKDGWTAAGSATNSGSTSRTYTITVFFTVPGGTVINHASTKVTVAPGQKGSWRAGAAFTPAPTTFCVLRGVA